MSISQSKDTPTTKCCYFKSPRRSYVHCENSRDSTHTVVHVSSATLALACCLLLFHKHTFGAQPNHAPLYPRGAGEYACLIEKIRSTENNDDGISTNCNDNWRERIRQQHRDQTVIGRACVCLWPRSREKRRRPPALFFFSYDPTPNG